MTNKNLPVGKQTLCEWTSTALKCALIAPNIRAGFRKAGIWPLDREAAKSCMAPSTGFEEGQPGLDKGGVTGGTSHRADGVTYPTNHPHLAAGAVTDRAGSTESGLQDVAACMHATHAHCEAECSSDSGPEDDRAGRGTASDDELPPAVPSAPSLGEVHIGVHYYVSVPHSEDAAYEAYDTEAPLELGIDSHLQEEGEQGDINTFLALPEIIPARQRRRQQALLDFTKSKFLTFRMYTEACERLLAQKEATQAEAKRKAEIREATKEIRRREKEEHQQGVIARKEARHAKQQEKCRSQAERRVQGEGGSRDARAPPMWGSPPRTPDAAAHAVHPVLLLPWPVAEIGAFAGTTPPSRSVPPASSALPAFEAPAVPQIHWPQASSQQSRPFWNNPILGMPHMFHHPLLSHHNGNSP